MHSDANFDVPNALSSPKSFVSLAWFFEEMKFPLGTWYTDLLITGSQRVGSVNVSKIHYAAKRPRITFLASRFNDRTHYAGPSPKLQTGNGPLPVPDPYTSPLTDVCNIHTAMRTSYSALYPSLPSSAPQPVVVQPISTPILRRPGRHLPGAWACIDWDWQPHT